MEAQGDCGYLKSKRGELCLCFSEEVNECRLCEPGRCLPNTLPGGFKVVSHLLLPAAYCQASLLEQPLEELCSSMLCSEASLARGSAADAFV